MMRDLVDDMLLLIVLAIVIVTAAPRMRTCWTIFGVALMAAAVACVLL